MPAAFGAAARSFWILHLAQSQAERSVFHRFSTLSSQSRRSRTPPRDQSPCSARPYPGQPPASASAYPLIRDCHCGRIEMTPPTSRFSPPAPFLKPATLDPNTTTEVVGLPCRVCVSHAHALVPRAHACVPRAGPAGRRRSAICSAPSHTPFTLPHGT